MMQERVIYGIGMTPSQVRRALGVSEPEPRPVVIADPFAPEPYEALLGDQKARNATIAYDLPIMFILGLSRFSTENIGAACSVSRECVRKRLVIMGVDRKLKRRVIAEGNADQL